MLTRNGEKKYHVELLIRLFRDCPSTTDIFQHKVRQGEKGTKRKND